IVVSYYFWLQNRASAPVPAADSELREPGTAEGPRHPLATDAAPDGEPLPSLEQSDDALSARARALLGESALELFHLDSIVRRVVVTIDGLGTRHVPQRYRLARSVPGRFAVVEDGEETVLGEKNYARYEPYVRLAQVVDTDELVAAYMHFYPLFQKEYENLGFHDAYFNDRVVAVIDELLATPEVKQPVRLVRPRVLYEFADPALESLSAGQKILVRMGPENASVIKRKLREIREALANKR